MTQYQVACFGEVLWDILPDKALPGGAPMNVAYHLQKLSIPVAMISSIGNDESGQTLLEIMKQYQLTTDFIQTDPVHETGKVYARPSAENPLEMKYEIVQPVAWDYISFTPDLRELRRPGLAHRNKKISKAYICRRFQKRNSNRPLSRNRK